jgi:DNA-directed RNA polymerase subunit RPC12/RpoP
MVEIDRPYGKMRILGGAHPELVDFKCAGCGLVVEDVYFKSKDDVAEAVTCSGCGNKAHKVILRTNFIHPSVTR